jgi:hypothetical protein
MQAGYTHIFDRPYDSNVGKFRKVLVATTALSRTKKAELRNASLAVVFSVTFLWHYEKELMRTKRELSNLCHRAQKVFENLEMKTISDLLLRKYEELRGVEGLGERTIALILDTLTLFGLTMKNVPHLANNTVSDLDKKAQELAQRIGIPKREE